MTSQHKTGTHPFLWQASIRPILIHFFDKLAKDRHSSIFMTSQHRTGTHPFLWQASIIPVLIHFFDKPSYRYSSILHRYVYTHIYTYLCTYIYFPEGMFTYFFTVHGLIEKNGRMKSQDLMSVRQLKSQQVIQVNSSSDELSKRNSHHSTFVLKWYLHIWLNIIFEAHKVHHKGIYVFSFFPE